MRNTHVRRTRTIPVTNGSHLGPSDRACSARTVRTVNVRREGMDVDRSDPYVLPSHVFVPCKMNVVKSHEFPKTSFKPMKHDPRQLHKPGERHDPRQLQLCKITKLFKPTGQQMGMSHLTCRKISNRMAEHRGSHLNYRNVSQTEQARGNHQIDGKNEYRGRHHI